MTEKQVVFRLEEELHRRLQMYAMQKNETVKEVMEDVVKQLLRGGQGIRPRMLKMVHQKFREQSGEIKEALRKACIDSIRLTSADKGTVLQVLINELGDIRILETQKGIVPMSVIDLKAYLLYEFECMSDISIWGEGGYYDEDEFIKPFEGKYKDFIKWLIKHGIEDFKDENGGPYLGADAEEIVDSIIKNEEYHQKYVNFTCDEDDYEEDMYKFLRHSHTTNHEEYLNCVYRWNPTIYRKIINSIRDSLLEWYVQEEVEKAWNEITCREELELNFE